MNKIVEIIVPQKKAPNYSEQEVIFELEIKAQNRKSAITHENYINNTTCPYDICRDEPVQEES